MYTFKKSIALLALSTLFVLGMDMSTLSAAGREGGARGGEHHSEGSEHMHQGQGGQHHENYQHHQNYGGEGEHRGAYEQQGNSTVVVPVNENNNGNNGSNWDPNAANPQTQGAQIFDSYDQNNR